MAQSTLRRNTQEELIMLKKQVLDRFIRRSLSRKDAGALLSMHPNAISRLKKRYLKYGISSLMPKKPGPKNITPVNRTPWQIENVVIQLAEDRPDLGPVPLAEELWDQAGIKLNSTTIWRILKRRKVRYSREYQRWVEEPQLYCLDQPGEEIQIDGSYPYGRARKVVSFDAIDDCSRWLFGRVYTRETTEAAIDFVKHLIPRVPFTVQRIRVDNRYGKKFKEYWEVKGIEVIENDPYTPEQNGKVERFHRTLKHEFFWKFCSYQDSLEFIQYKYYLWQNHYNTKRRHGGFGMNRMTPQEKVASTMFQLLPDSYPQKVTLTMQQYKSTIKELDMDKVYREQVLVVKSRWAVRFRDGKSW
jgi:transposase